MFSMVERSRSKGLEISSSTRQLLYAILVCRIDFAIETTNDIAAIFSALRISG